MPINASISDMKVPCTIVPGVPHIPFQYPASASSSLRLNDEIHSQFAYTFSSKNDKGSGIIAPTILASVSSYLDEHEDFFQNFATRPPHAYEAIPVAAGTLAFTALLSLSTFLQFKFFKTSTGTIAPIPSLLGIGSVATAALCSHIVSIKSYQIVRQHSAPYPYYDSYHTHSPFQILPIDLSMGSRQNVAHALRVCALGMLAYKGLGGRFWSISPSNLTNLGSFARTIFSIPATKNYANASQRAAVERLGKRMGCHTCGSREILSRGKNGVRFIADHMPPQSAVAQMENRWFRRLLGMRVQQRFYPQCTSCSGLQGGILSEATRKKVSNLANAGGGKYALNHAGRFRLEHLAGGIVAAATVCGSSDWEVLGETRSDGTLRGSGGNRRRFLEWQIRATDFWNSWITTVEEMFES